MSVSIVAAVGQNYELGKNNDLIWHFKDDMRFFKSITVGNTVIMGRKTFESMPKALPYRRNIVITSDKTYSAENIEVAFTPEQALEMAGDEDVFIIGGGRVYAQFINIADRIYLTEIEDSCDDAEVFFPQFNKEKYERMPINKYEVDGIIFRHVLYKKKTDE